MSYTNIPLVISASGVSSGFSLPTGEHWLVIKASGWGSVTLQVSPDNSAGSYEDAKDSSGNAITITGNWNFPVAGGMFYRLNVTSYSQPITVNARRATR
jgi:hypothetical protein